MEDKRNKEDEIEKISKIIAKKEEINLMYPESQYMHRHLIETVRSGIFLAEEKGSMAGEMKGSGYEQKGSAHEEGTSAYSKDDLKVTKEDMQNAMKSYVETEAAANDGVFKLKDEKTGKVRRLSYIDLHKGLSMAGAHHYSCADFKDLDSGEVLDVDIYVDMTDEGLKVTDAAIHKVDGKPQFIYGGRGVRMPADHAHMKGAEKKGSGSE